MTVPAVQSKGPSALLTAAWTCGAIVPWATMAAAIGHALKAVPSTQLLFWVFLFATPASFFWDRQLGGRAPNELFKVSGRVVAIGLLGIFGWSAGVFLSLDRAPVIEANLLTYLWPLLMVVMAPLAGENFSFASLFGATIGFAGAVLVVTGGNAVAVQTTAMLGYGLALTGALAWAFFVVLLQRQGEPGTRRTPVFVFGAFVCSMFVALGVDGGITLPPTSALLAAAWLGIGPLSLAFICWDRAVMSNHLGLVGRLSYFDPLFSTLLLMIFLGLLPSRSTWIGMAMIIAGVAVPELWGLWASKKRTLQKLTSGGL